jgi:hypothetical protein
MIELTVAMERATSQGLREPRRENPLFKHVGQSAAKKKKLITQLPSISQNTVYAKYPSLTVSI